MTTFRLYTAAFGEHIMRSAAMKAEMARRAELVRARAIALAPQGKPGNNRPGRVHYKESFAPVSVDVGRADYTGWGAMGRRAYASVVNTAPQALHVEYGVRGRSRRYRPLGKALTAARG